MKYFLLLICLFRIVNGWEDEEKSICAGDHATSERVINFCSDAGGTMIVRCCRSEDNATFLAIDLQNANLTGIPDFSGTDNLNLSVIDLRGNPELKASLHNDDFVAMKYLNELLLPKQVQCPGGSKIWEQINNTYDADGSHYCVNQIDVCVNSTDLCVEHGSACNANGPAQFLCLCQSGYSGYKCLRYGKFPSGIFYGSTAGVTILASALLYWTQRRHVKK